MCEIMYAHNPAAHVTTFSSLARFLWKYACDSCDSCDYVMAVVDQEKTANNLQLFYNNNEPNDFTQTKANLVRYHVDSRLSRQPPRLFYLVAELGSTPTEELSSRFAQHTSQPSSNARA